MVPVVCTIWGSSVWLRRRCQQTIGRFDDVRDGGATSFVSNYRSFDFFISNLTTHLIQKFVQNITSFVVGCFIDTRSSRTT